uniref:Alcohol dehydrogenase n=1 Tax=Solanum tuberosum TaxID=4113 RepID=M1BGV1_SOLTU
MAMELESKEWYVASYAPTGVPNSDHLKLRTVTLSIPDDHVAFQILYVSIDPYMRTQLSGLHDGLSLPQIPLGQVKLLKEECGYDEAFNYQIETDYDAALTK